MSVRSFRSVFMASAVAGAALGCYLVSLRVASERAALEAVENQIVLAQRDIRLLQTEIGTRARLAQLERWNVRVLALSAPTADQILGDKFQLASLIAPERKPALDAPVILATAPAPKSQQTLTSKPEVDDAGRSAGELLHVASLKTLDRETPSKFASPPMRSVETNASAPKTPGNRNKADGGQPREATPAATKPVRTAKIDPLAPLPADASNAEGSRTNR